MPVFTVPFDDFGGLDLASASNATGGAIDLLNVELDKPGRLRSRDGYLNLTASAGASRYDSVFPLATAASVSSSVKFAGTGADDTSVGTVAWSGTGNIFATDAVYAAATLAAGATSHYLKATNFGFAIPGTATVVGVVAAITRRSTFGLITDSSVKLVKAGAVVGSDKSTGATWPSGAASAGTFGSASDLWGTTLTAADVNAANFGIVAAARASGGSGVAAADSVTITVYYQPLANIAVAGASLSRLDVIATDGTVAATLATATDTQQSYAAFGSPTTSAVYIANSANTIRKLVGTTFSTPAGMPRAKFVALQSPANRLVAANIAAIPAGAASTASTSLVHFSDALTPETWSANNYVYLTPGDNEDIQGVVSWRTHLFVFKSSKFFDFYGNSTDTAGQPVFNFRTITGAGLAAPLAVTAGPNGVYFLDRRGIYFTTGGPPQRISAAIDRLFQGGTSFPYTAGSVNPAALAQASMCWFQDRLYIGLPLGTATTNDHTLVFDPTAQTWTLWDIPMGAMAASASQPARLLFTLAQGANHVGQYAPNAYTDDAGTAITATYRSAFVPLDWRGRTIRSGIHGVDKTVRESLLEGSGVVSYSLTNQWVAAGDVPTPVSLTLGTSPAIALARDRRAVRGRMFSFQLSGNSPWEVQTVYWNVHGYQAAGEQSEAA